MNSGSQNNLNRAEREMTVNKPTFTELVIVQSAALDRECQGGAYSICALSWGMENNKQYEIHKVPNI